MVAKVVTRDLSPAVTRAPHVTRSLCLPKSLSSQSFLPVQTPSFYYPLVEKESRSKSHSGASKRPHGPEVGDNCLKKKILSMENSCQENEEPQSTLKTDKEQPPVEQSPENQCSEEEQSSEDLSSEEQSSEEEFFPEELLPELLPEMLLSEDRPPQECLSRKNLFEDRPPMEQPPCGVGKHKLEEGSFKERLARSRPQFRGDIHGRNLSNEEMIQAADELEEMKRVRNKLMIMHWKAKRSRPYPI
ncbi:hypothetical protein A6R68_01246 [Neotoma lepida]|uniref:Uncharacterized protein n=1 Tax=Neotoma lepida TaxID=56216 RepID=A0A1A6GXY6_NEOLE|nr:hypothetical protein A6R68_01246 [Neotoma lepida]